MAFKLHDATKCASWLKRQEGACKTSCQWGPSFFCTCDSTHWFLAVGENQHKFLPQISCRSWVLLPSCCATTATTLVQQGEGIFLSTEILCPCIKSCKERWIAGMAEHAKVVTIIGITLHRLGSEAYAISVEIPRQFRCDWLQAVGMQCLQFHILPQDIWAHFPVLPLGWDTTEALSEPIGIKGEGRHSTSVHICFLSLAGEDAGTDAGYDGGFWHVGSLPFQKLMDGFKFMEARCCMQILFWGWIWTRPLWKKHCADGLLLPSKQTNALPVAVTLNCPLHLRVHS